MASVWIRTRRTKDGTPRYRLEYRIGGRETPTRFGGSFKTKRLATLRAALVDSELAAGRIPNLALVEAEAPKLPLLLMAFDTWRATRVDVDEQTQNMHRSSVGRIFKVAPHLRNRRIDELTVNDVAVLIAGLANAGYKRETIRKTRTVLSQTLDFYKLDPNVAPRRPREAAKGTPAAHPAASRGARRAHCGNGAERVCAAAARDRRVRTPGA